MKTHTRYELKIPIPAYLLPEIEAWIWLHSAHWRVAYPPRQVNNVYFDTFAYAGLNANLGGVADRTKLRLRWYGSDLAQVRDANLELKCKQGKAGWKEVSAVERVFDLSALSWPAFVDALRCVVSSQARSWLERFASPVLINSYQRAYYVTLDGMLRLTIDSALCSYNQRVSTRPNLRLSTRLNTCVVELKAPTEDDATRRLSTVLADFPARVGRFSKYVHGVLASPDF